MTQNKGGHVPADPMANRFDKPLPKSILSPTRRVPAPADTAAQQQAEQTQPRIHGAHHDFPFSHAEAAEKQHEAMTAARAQALAQLEATKQNAADQSMSQTGQGGGLKGPRRTYETSTSGPSFGHIMHQDGQPLRMSGPQIPPGFAQSTPMTRDMGGAPPFMRIPFGVPLGASIPRPLFVMRNSVGVGMGVGLGGGLEGMPNMAQMPGPPDGQHYINAPSPEQKRKDDRSAYVETIEDVSQMPQATLKYG